MSMTDPIGSMLTTIRNASHAKHSKVDIPYSKIKEQVVKVLRDENYVKNYKVIEYVGKQVIRVYLRYTDDDKCVITGLKRISKPGLRVYVGLKEIPRVLGGLGIAILSTPKGVMTNKKAKLAQVGGELICEVW